MFNIIGLLAIAFLVSVLLTVAMRRYAISKKIFDIPNVRSSHYRPTPRGGGVAIVLTFLIGMLVLRWIGYLETKMLLGFMVAGVIVALVGFIDDIRHIAARWRLLAHFLAAAWALILLGGLPPLQVFDNVLDLEWIGDLLAVVYLVWLLNLYNFMDGIDGIASIEAITVCIGSIALYWMIAPDVVNWAGSALLLVAVSGFLIWNLPPAKIFMGDVGSGFIGLMLGVMSIQAAWNTPALFWSWLILLGVFLVDATVTLFKRILRGEKCYQAHRNHAYQWSALRWGHSRVILGVAIINLFWLFPLACFALLFPEYGIVVMVTAFIPLVFLAAILGAGQSQAKKI